MNNCMVTYIILFAYKIVNTVLSTNLIGLFLNVVNTKTTTDSKVAPAEKGTNRSGDNLLSIILRLLPPTVSEDGKQWLYVCSMVIRI